MDDESSMRSSAVRGNFTSGRRRLGWSSSVLKAAIKEFSATIEILLVRSLFRSETGDKYRPDWPLDLTSYRRFYLI